MRKQMLNGQWHMTGGGYSCRGTVPGSVYSFLLNDGQIPDPYYRTNELAALEILEHDFTFRRTFCCEKQAGVPVLLCCEGLDTLCDLYINGSFVGHADNMHRSFTFDVTALLKNGENEITAFFPSPNRYIKEKYAQDPVPGNPDALVGFCHLRKAHCMMGWDWGPRLPDAGIWKDIYLLHVDSNRITDVHITQRHENGRVFVFPQVQTASADAALQITVTTPADETLNLPANTESEIPDPMLWWPNGFGKANLYRFQVELLEQGIAVDTVTQKIGLRTLKLIREPDAYGESFCHEVNGLRIFAMGADYIPEDNLLSRITKERSETLLRHCVDCNFNAIRVWGGGFYPQDFFFELCDELGLLVFMDLMFACMSLPTDAEMQSNIALEARENLIRMRHHPCIAVISGNNEMEQGIVCNWYNDPQEYRRKQVYLQYFEHTVPDLVRELCPYIPYVPSSPSSMGSFQETMNENYGDSHYWAVWHGGLPFTEYRNHYFRYLSEFGFASFPCEKTVAAFTEPGDRNIFSRVMEMHQRCKGANRKILTYLADTFLYPQDFGTLLYASQLLQAEAIRYGVEHLRRHRGRCMGTLYWQLNDIWPTASWASIDYFGRYKALQYVAKRFYAPVLISCMETGETTTRPYVILEQGWYDYSTQAQLCVTNETLLPVSGTAEWSLRTAAGDILETGCQEVTVPPQQALWLDNINFHKTDVENHYLSYRFLVHGQPVSQGTALFTVPKHFNFRDPHLRYTLQGDEITVYADCYAKYVEIDSPDSDFLLSDNYFDMDGGSRTVKILKGNPKTIRLRSVYDIR